MVRIVLEHINEDYKSCINRLLDYVKVQKLIDESMKKKTVPKKSGPTPITQIGHSTMTGFHHGRISKQHSLTSTGSSSRMESFLAGRSLNHLINCLLPLHHQGKLHAMHVASRDISPEMPHAELGLLMLLKSRPKYP